MIVCNRVGHKEDAACDKHEVMDGVGGLAGGGDSLAYVGEVLAGHA